MLNATSPSAQYDKRFEVAPPGADPVKINPTAWAFLSCGFNRGRGLGYEEGVSEGTRGNDGTWWEGKKGKKNRSTIKNTQHNKEIRP